MTAPDHAGEGPAERAAVTDAERMAAAEAWIRRNRPSEVPTDHYCRLWLAETQYGQSMDEALQAAAAARPDAPDAAALREEVERLRAENTAWRQEAQDRLDDLGRLLRALGLSDHARPIAPADVFDLCLRDIEGMRQRILDAEADAVRLHHEKMEQFDRATAAEARAEKAERALEPLAAVGRSYVCRPGTSRLREARSQEAYLWSCGQDDDRVGITVEHARQAAQVLAAAIAPRLGAEEAAHPETDGGSRGE